MTIQPPYTNRFKTKPNPNYNLNKLNLSYKIEPLGDNAWEYTIEDSNIDIVTDDGGVTLYEKRRSGTSDVELSIGEAYTLLTILKEYFDAASTSNG